MQAGAWPPHSRSAGAQRQPAAVPPTVPPAIPLSQTKCMLAGQAGAPTHLDHTIVHQHGVAPRPRAQALVSEVKLSCGAQGQGRGRQRPPGSAPAACCPTRSGLPHATTAVHGTLSQQARRVFARLASHRAGAPLPAGQNDTHYRRGARGHRAARAASGRRALGAGAARFSSVAHPFAMRLMPTNMVSSFLNRAGRLTVDGLGEDGAAVRQHQHLAVRAHALAPRVLRPRRPAHTRPGFGYSPQLRPAGTSPVLLAQTEPSPQLRVGRLPLRAAPGPHPSSSAGLERSAFRIRYLKIN